MFNCFKSFWRDERGAVTVDWIVLTAAVTWLGLSAVGALQDAVQTLAERLETSVSAGPVSQ